MIENSERGFTIAKPLAWSMVIGILTLGFWQGVEQTQTKEGVRVLNEKQIEDRRAIRVNAEAINNLRFSNARIESKLESIDSKTDRTDNNVEEILKFLREGGGQ